MLFFVVGTPWKIPRSSRGGFPACVGSWFGGKSSTRTATLRMRLRNSSGSESSAPSTTSTKCSRVIGHRVKSTARSLRVAVAAIVVTVVIFFVVVIFVVIIFVVIDFAIIVLFVVVIVRFSSKEDAGSHPPIRIGV